MAESGVFNASTVERRLSTLLRVEKGATLVWATGDVYLGADGNLSIAGTLRVTAEARLRASTAAFGFDRTADAVLNIELDAAAMFPRGAAVDIGIDNPPYIKGIEDTASWSHEFVRVVDGSERPDDRRRCVVSQSAVAH